MTILEVTLELPDNLAAKAKQAGLLAPKVLAQIIADALRDKAFDDFLSNADRVESAGITPMSDEDIQAEIGAYRLERQRAGH